MHTYMFVYVFSVSFRVTTEILRAACHLRATVYISAPKSALSRVSACVFMCAPRSAARRAGKREREYGT